MLAMILAGAAHAAFVEEDVLVLWKRQGYGTYYGWAVAEVGDVDGDGVRDVATGDPYSGDYRGLTVVLSGATGDPVFETSPRPGTAEGYAVAGGADLDGDGVPDVLSGAPGASEVALYSGATHERFGVLEGDPSEFFGGAVALVGDVDGDGVEDVLVGAERASGTAIDEGRVSLWSGADGTPLWSVPGAGAGDFLGSAAARLGDVTGDGVPDVLAGGRGNGGHVYVLDGVDGARVREITVEGGVAFGRSFVAGLGDVDGDGVPDIYTGDYAHDGNGQQSGHAWVWSGRTGALVWDVAGDARYAGLGTGGPAGDVDGDGVVDLVLGSYLSSAAGVLAGQVSVYSGRDGAVLRTITSKRDGENFGFDATGLGDVDGDGVVDLLVSAATDNTVYLIGTVPPADTGQPPPTETPEPAEGCGCASTGRPAAWTLAALLLCARRRVPPSTAGRGPPIAIEPSFELPSCSL